MGSQFDFTVSGIMQAALAACAVLGALSACASTSDAVIISYETEDGSQALSFTPGTLRCNHLGASGLSFPEEPVNSVSIFEGTPGQVTVWEQDKELVLFYSEDATVESTALDDGSTSYHVTAAHGEVAIADVVGQATTEEPDLSQAERYPGSIEMNVRCAPNADN